MDKLTQDERDELDKAGRWRPTANGWIVCDPAMDGLIAALHPETLARIRANTKPLDACG